MTCVQINDISPNDDMFAGNRDLAITAPENADFLRHYLSCGSQLASYVSSELDRPLEKLLEIPCGHGRVTRHLIAQLPRSEIWTADILPSAIGFQNEVLATRGVLINSVTFDYSVVPDNYFDFILVGSLVTHLSEQDSVEFLTQMESKLAEGGALLITTHGARAFDLLKEQKTYEITEEDRSSLLSAYESGGFGFVKYDRNSDFTEKRTVEFAGDVYGVSLSHKDWLVKTMTRLGIPLQKYIAGGWDNHQDVFLFSKRPSVR